MISENGMSKAIPVATKVKEFSEDDDVASLEFAPDGSRLAVGTFLTLHIHLWDLHSRPRVVQTLLKPPNSADYTSWDGVHFSPGGTLMAVAHGVTDESNGRSVVSVFSVATGASEHSIPEPKGGGGYTRIAFSADGKFLARTFDSARPPDRYQFMVHGTDTFEQIWGLRIAPLYPRSLALSQDGRMAAVGGIRLVPGVADTAQIVIIDLTARKIIRTINEALPQNDVQELAWHPDSIHLAAGGVVGEDSDKSDAVRIFDVSTGEVVSREGMGSAHIWALRYTQNGRYLVESGFGKTVRIWDGQHTHLLQEIPAKDCYALAVSRDSTSLAVSDGRKVTVWTLK
jgi:WD40 repeat protein